MDIESKDMNNKKYNKNHHVMQQINEKTIEKSVGFFQSTK